MIKIYKWITLLVIGWVPCSLFAFEPVGDTLTLYQVGRGPISVFAADLDGDGDNDIAVVNLGSTVSVFMNNGDGTFTTRVDYATGGSPYSVFASDLDGDGDLDLATANAWGMGPDLGSVSVLNNTGDGTFAPKVDYATGRASWSVFASDLDSDGNQDLVVANSGDKTISILKNNGDGTFAPKVDYQTAGQPASVYAADLDLDGDQDVAAANLYDGNFVSVFMNNGDGTFTAKIDYNTGVGPSSVFISDMDQDQDNDLAVANAGNPLFPATVSVFKNNGDGTFATKADYVTGNWPRSVFASDLDGDTDLDLVTANYHSIGTVSVLKNNGDGTFSTKVDLPTNGIDPTSVFVSDLDGDGDRDLVVANINSNTISVLKNQGDGTFCPAKPGDVNADRKYDLMDIVEEVKVVFKGGTYPAPVCLADANADGMPTIIDIIILVNKVFKGGPDPLPIGVCCL